MQVRGSKRWVLCPGSARSSVPACGLAAAARHVRWLDAVLFAGDLSYADGDGPRWDSYARIGEPLWAHMPTAHTGGNHEVSNGGENWLGYSKRYPNAHAMAGSASFLWYSFEAGPAHVVMLCSYADFHMGSSQYAWLQRDLATFDRSKTPWPVT